MSELYTPTKYTSDYYEYEKYDTPISVVGRLRSRSDYWQSIGCSQYILDTIRRGYIIPITDDVESAYLRNNKSSRDEPVFVRKAIDELLDTGAIVECKGPTWVVNPLTVAKKGGKFRLVLDLRHINAKIKKEKCKFEGHDTALQYLSKDGYMSAFDLKAGYHHIDIASEQQDLLGFSYPDWKENTRYFKFVVLPFGLSTAGLIFTKVLREIMKTWRGQCIQAVCFLDDGLQANQTKDVVERHALIMKGTLLSAGWIPHRSKSQWVPVQVIQWLGFLLDLAKGKIFCSKSRIDETKLVLNNILKSKVTHIKYKLASMDRSHGDLVHMMTRFMNLAISEAPSWNCSIVVLPALERELKFWQRNIDSENGRDLFPSVATGQIDCILHSDASNTGCATVLTPEPNRRKLIVNRMFNEQESLSSSTERELLGVLHGITHFRHVLTHTNINWFTDAKNVARIAKRGSKKPYLANLAVAIYQVAKKHSINLNLIWIPRDQNEEADFWSRVRDFDDWGVSPQWFQKICDYCDFKATIDRFADPRNKKVKRFNTRFYHCQSEATDAFSQNWQQEKNWVVPFIFLINRTIRYCQMCAAEMILVFPKWKTAVFWPAIQDILQNKPSVIRHQLVMGNIFVKGTTETSIFGSPKWKGQSMALHLKFW